MRIHNSLLVTRFMGGAERCMIIYRHIYVMGHIGTPKNVVKIEISQPITEIGILA